MKIKPDPGGGAGDGPQSRVSPKSSLQPAPAEELGAASGPVWGFTLPACCGEREMACREGGSRGRRRRSKVFSAPTVRVPKARGRPEPSRGEAARGSRARDGPGTPLAAPGPAPPRRSPRPSAPHGLRLRPVRGRGDCVRARACTQAGEGEARGAPGAGGRASGRAPQGGGTWQSPGLVRCAGARGSVRARLHAYVCVLV